MLVWNVHDTVLKEHNRKKRLNALSLEAVQNKKPLMNIRNTTSTNDRIVSFTGILLCVCAALTFAAASAHASLISFDFNSLKDGASNSKVKTYMQGVVTTKHPGGTVNVTGSQAEKDYTGDNHVVGPVSGHSVSSETLGTSDGGVHHTGDNDTYLINNDADRITITFSFPIYLASFDQEIFPDGTCPKLSLTCQPTSASWPDLTFQANNVAQFEELGIVPGQSGTYPHSPDSHYNVNEKAPQYLGVSGNWAFASGVTKLEFIDWPQHIGIDNLQVYDNVCDLPNGCPSNNTPSDPTPHTPEPSSLWLVGSGLLSALGVGTSRRKRRT